MVPKRSPRARGGSVHKHMKEFKSSSDRADHHSHLVEMLRDERKGMKILMKSKVHQDGQDR